MIFCCVIESKKMIVFLKNRMLKDIKHILFVGFLMFSILVSCNKVNNKNVLEHTQYISTRPSLFKTLISAALLFVPKVSASSVTQQEYWFSDLDLDLKDSKGLLIGDSVFLGIRNLDNDDGFAIISNTNNVPVYSSDLYGWHNEHLDLRSINRQQNTEYLQDMRPVNDSSILLTLSNTHEIEDGTAIGFYNIDSKHFEMLYLLNTIDGLYGVNLLTINQDSLIAGGYNDNGILFAYCDGIKNLSLDIKPGKTYMLYNGKDQIMELDSSVMIDNSSTRESIFFSGTHRFVNNDSTHLLVGGMAYDDDVLNVYTIVGPGKSKGSIIKQEGQNIILCEERQKNLTQNGKSIFIYNISFENVKLTNINRVSEIVNLYNATCKDIVVNHSDIFVSGRCLSATPKGYIAKLYSDNMSHHVLEGSIKIFGDVNSQYSEINNIYTYGDNINFFGYAITHSASNILTGDIDFNSFQNNQSCGFTNLEAEIKDVTNLFNISTLLLVDARRGPYLQYSNARSAKKGFSIVECYISDSCDSTNDPTLAPTLEPTLSPVAIKEINHYEKLYNWPDYVFYLIGTSIGVVVIGVFAGCWYCKKRRDLHIRKIDEMSEISGTKNGLNTKAGIEYSISADADLAYTKTSNDPHRESIIKSATTTNPLETANFLGFEPHNDDDEYNNDEKSSKLEEEEKKKEEEKMSELTHEQKDNFNNKNDDLYNDRNNDGNSHKDAAQTIFIPHKI